MVSSELSYQTNLARMHQNGPTVCPTRRVPGAVSAQPPSSVASVLQRIRSWRERSAHRATAMAPVPPAILATVIRREAR